MVTIAPREIQWRPTPGSVILRSAATKNLSSDPALPYEQNLQRDSSLHPARVANRRERKARDSTQNDRALGWLLDGTISP